MGRVGTMEELQNLAVFLISGGCDWINGETIAMDGAQALAMGGNFYQLRDWCDADWERRAIRSRRRTRRTARRGARLSSPRTQGPITTIVRFAKATNRIVSPIAAAYGSLLSQGRRAYCFCRAIASNSAQRK